MRHILKSKKRLPTDVNGWENGQGNKSFFDALPESAFVREAQLVQSPKRPGYPAPLPFSPPTLWRKVKAGTFPAPVKLSERVTCWRVSEVRAWLNGRDAAATIKVPS